MKADGDHLQKEAAAWLARLRAPDGDRDRARFEAWRARSPAHATAFACVERQWQRSLAIGQSRLASTSALAKPWWHVGGASGQFALAGMAAAALLVMGWHMLLPPALPSPVRFANSVGQLRTLKLSDGSTVTLDTDSIVSISFTDHERRIRLDRGRARFDVARDPQRRFVVATERTLVVAHGTIFDVDARPDREEVSLIEGAVDVATISGRTSRTGIKLSSGQRAVMTVATGYLSLARPMPPEAVNWTSGMLSFDAATLDQVVEEANRYSATKLVLGEPSLGRLRVTGAFRASAQRELAGSLAEMFGLRIETEPAGIIRLESPAGPPPRRQGG
jgi:transmembrane sensor